jgi:hypothetical protein
MNRNYDNPSPMRRAALAFPAECSRSASEQWNRMTGKRLGGNRRIDALARRLNILGHFSNESPGPRAA